MGKTLIIVLVSVFAAFVIFFAGFFIGAFVTEDDNQSTPQSQVVDQAPVNPDEYTDVEQPSETQPEINQPEKEPAKPEPEKEEPKQPVNVSSTILEIDDNGFYSQVRSEKGKYICDMPCIVDFNATWCGPCQQLKPGLKAIAKKYAGKIRVFGMDVDECETVPAKFNCQSIPLLIFFNKDGKTHQSLGYISQAEIESLVKQYCL